MLKIAIALFGFCILMPSAKAQGIGSGGLPVSTIVCDKSVAITATAGANMTKIISLLAPRPTYLCGFMFIASAGGSVQIKYGTKVTNECDTGTVAMTGNMLTVTSTNIVYGASTGSVLKIPAGFDTCILATTGNITGIATYAQ